MIEVPPAPELGFVALAIAALRCECICFIVGLEVHRFLNEALGFRRRL